jgi:hypothetical protein
MEDEAVEEPFEVAGVEAPDEEPVVVEIEGGAGMFKC